MLIREKVCDLDILEVFDVLIKNNISVKPYDIIIGKNKDVTLIDNSILTYKENRWSIFK